MGDVESALIGVFLGSERFSGKTGSLSSLLSSWKRVYIDICIMKRRSYKHVDNNNNVLLCVNIL